LYCNRDLLTLSPNVPVLSSGRGSGD
jgi:hypothetical protein